MTAFFLSNMNAVSAADFRHEIWRLFPRHNFALVLLSIRRYSYATQTAHGFCGSFRSLASYILAGGSYCDKEERRSGSRDVERGGSFRGR